MPSCGVLEIDKTKISCKQADSVQYKAHCVQAPPHAPQKIKVHSWSHASNSYIHWDAINWWMVRNNTGHINDIESQKKSITFPKL